MRGKEKRLRMIFITICHRESFDSEKVTRKKNLGKVTTMNKFESLHFLNTRVTIPISE